ncbi:MAG: hypothetical protein FJY29_05235 [Betaproteobacteria bacterium]|nr:hypothetical protein [Betaproteobacteria bacterium]
MKFGTMFVKMRALLALSLTVCACQPQTKRDRAGVGPEVAITPADAGASPGSGNTAPDAADNSTAQQPSGGVEWESSLKNLCDQGKPSACSQLAYEAQRGKRTDEAIAYFVRACLMDGTLSQCPSPQTAVKGLSRACLELAGLYTQKGRTEEAQQFKRCACDRGFKLACN